MAGIMGIDHSIGWAHWQLRGAWRSTLKLLVGYLILFFAGITVSLRSEIPMAQTLSTWRTLLLVVQSGLLLLMGVTRIMNAIRTDATSRMHESHRLMRVSAASAISGYIWGPTLQSIILASVNFVAGLVITMQSGMGLEVWVLPNLVLLSFALFIWVVGAFGASFGKNTGGAGMLMLMLMGFSRGVTAILLPGMAVLVNPLAGTSIYDPGAGWSVRTSLVLSIACQVFIGAILYWGAMRKYHRPENSALGVLPAILLLVGWVGTSGIGLAMWEDFRPRFLGNEEPEWYLIVIASIGVSMLVACCAIGNAGRERRTGPWSPLVALLCTGIILPLVWFMLSPIHAYQNAVAYTAIVIATFLLDLCFLLRIIYRFAANGWLLATAWIVILVGAPLTIDYGKWAMSNYVTDYVASPIVAYSPIGALTNIWSDSGLNVMPGLIFQTGTAAAWAILFYATQRRKRVHRTSDPIGQTVS